MSMSVGERMNMNWHGNSYGNRWFMVVYSPIWFYHMNMMFTYFTFNKFILFDWHDMVNWNWIACCDCLMPVFFVNDHVNVSWSFRLDLDLQTSNQSLKNKQNNMVTACSSTSTNFKSTSLSSKHRSNIVPKSWQVQVHYITCSQLAIFVNTLVPFPKSHCCFMDLYLFPQS